MAFSPYAFPFGPYFNPFIGSWPAAYLGPYAMNMYQPYFPGANVFIGAPSGSISYVGHPVGQTWVPLAAASGRP